MYPTETSHQVGYFKIIWKMVLYTKMQINGELTFEGNKPVTSESRGSRWEAGRGHKAARGLRRLGAGRLPLLPLARLLRTTWSARQTSHRPVLYGKS